MDQDGIISVLQALASGPRLDVYRLLLRNPEEGMVAGEISEQLSIPPTNLSFHLKALNHAGLVSVAAEGRYQRYRANVSMMQALIGYLTEECCDGNPSACLVPADDPREAGPAIRRGGG